MADKKKIKRALVSVYCKDGLDGLLAKLNAEGVSFISTGGTRKYIESLGYECEAVEAVTSYPSIFGGRVKTLHPKIFGGILFRRDNEDDLRQAAEYDITAIDLVIVDLYPFTSTVAGGAPETDIIEKIDIGGISLIRAAAKNFEGVTIVASREEYSLLAGIIDNQGAQTTRRQRRELACRAFEVSSKYDTAIHDWFASTNR
ncbi:MAG: IMP cyclohydrolase [Prevotella sp.]|nr:IMP cyclohydrolase [Prevotella sp.]